MCLIAFVAKRQHSLSGLLCAARIALRVLAAADSSVGRATFPVRLFGFTQPFTIISALLLDHLSSLRDSFVVISEYFGISLE